MLSEIWKWTKVFEKKYLSGFLFLGKRTAGISKVFDISLLQIFVASTSYCSVPMSDLSIYFSKDAGLWKRLGITRLFFSSSTSGVFEFSKATATFFITLRRSEMKKGRDPVMRTMAGLVFQMSHRHSYHHYNFWAHHFRVSFLPKCNYSFLSLGSFLKLYSKIWKPPNLSYFHFFNPTSNSQYSQTTHSSPLMFGPRPEYSAYLFEFLVVLQLLYF